MTTYDIHNHRKKFRCATQGNKCEELLTLHFFKRIKSDDPGAVMDIVCDEQQNIQIIHVQISEVRWTLLKYPDLLFIDSTYKINAKKMPLFCFMTVDGNHSGQIVAYAVVSNETGDTVIKLLEVFVSHNIAVKEKIETVMIDKDFAEMKAIKAVLPGANILICKFHVLRAIQRAMKDFSSTERDNVLAIIRKMMMC